MVLFDVVFFGKLVLFGAFNTTQEILPTKYLPEFDNQRVFDSTNTINGNNALFHKAWGLFGYSIFAPQQIDTYLKSLGFRSVRTQEGLDDLHIQSDYFVNELKSLGITKINTVQGVIDTDIKFFPLKNPQIEVLSLNTSEQKHSLDIKSELPTTLQTYLRYDYDWQLYINGVSSPIKNENGYLSFEVPEGLNHVVIKFVPMHFYKNL